MRRRDFCKLLGAGSAAVLVNATPALAKESPAPPSDDAFGVLVDAATCIGCRKCEWACNVENSLTNRPASAYDDKSVLDSPRRMDQDTFTVVNRVGNPEQPEKPWNMKLQCMHCVDPACASACLVGAMRKDPRGPVTYDAWKCIGCRYCMVACPFQVPAYEYHDPLTPRVRKCTFCLPRLAEGKAPACVTICPNEALTFGTRKAVLEAAHTRIQMNPGRYVDHVYGESEVGGTSWVYIAPVDFARSSLPVLDEKPVPEHTEPIQHGLFKSFVPPLALYGLLGLAMHSLRKGNGEGLKGGSHD